MLRPFGTKNKQTNKQKKTNKMSGAESGLGIVTSVWSQRQALGS